MYNQCVTIERDALSTPSNTASAGRISGEESEPCSQVTTDSPCSEPLRGDTPHKPQTIREFEHALRTLGFTARESKKIAHGGFKATQSDINELADRLEELAKAFKEHNE